MTSEHVAIPFSYNPNADNFQAVAGNIADGLLSNGIKVRDSYLDRSALCDHIYRNGFIGIVDSLTSATESVSNMDSMFKYESGYRVRIDKRGGKSNMYVLTLEPFN